MATALTVHERGEIAAHNGNGADLPVRASAAQDSAVRAFTGSTSAEEFAAIVKMAEMLVPTGMLPDHIKTPGQAVAIILAGREMGMPPMRSLRSLAMVKGKITEYADSQLARFKTDGGRAVFRHLDEERAELWLRHPNGDEHEEVFTIEDAKRAGLGDMYRKYPKAMLRSRVITAGLKSVGWEGGAGTYDPSELADLPAPVARDARPANVSQDGEEVAAEDVLMPMGRTTKGMRLGDIQTAELESASNWMREHGKYPDVVETIGVVLASRSSAADGDSLFPEDEPGHDTRIDD